MARATSISSASSATAADDRHLVVRHHHEPTVHGRSHLVARGLRSLGTGGLRRGPRRREARPPSVGLTGLLGPLDAHHADVDGADEVHVVGEKGDVAPVGAHHDRLGLAGEEHALGRDELGVGQVRHRAQSRSSVLALAITSSTPPTFKKACSGTSSRSPPTSASKLRTVSSIGT